MNPYSVLGVPRDASPPEVARAYRRLAKRYHPDLHQGQGAAKQMTHINSAWELLSNPIHRKRYDAEHPARGATVGGHWSATRVARPAAQPAATWNGAWSAPAGARGYAPPYRPDLQDDGPGWQGFAFAVLLGLVAIVAIVSGILPFPLVGLAVIGVARGIGRRFEGSG